MVAWPDASIISRSIIVTGVEPSTSVRLIRVPVTDMGSSSTNSSSDSCWENTLGEKNKKAALKPARRAHDRRHRQGQFPLIMLISRFYFTDSLLDDGVIPFDLCQAPDTHRKIHQSQRKLSPSAWQES